jgi:hypothetical protein
VNHDFGLGSIVHLRALAGLSAVLLLLACSNGTHHADDTSEGGAGNSGPSGTVSCVSDARLDPAEAGFEKAGSNAALWFRLEKIEPAPPSKGDNIFTISVHDEAGEPFTGALGAKAKMPDHGHESPTVPVVSLDADSATYTVSDVNLFMAGVWQVTFSCSESATTTPPMDSASFYFCIQG